MSLLALGATLVHVQVNYDPAMREIVRTKAAITTLAVSFPLLYFIMLQMLKNSRLSEELQRLVDRDRLTDVATRDFFFSRMAEAPDAYGVSLMVDIDYFKRINDTYGHLAGDEVIKEVAGLLRDSVRPEDIVARFGGEEFIIFLHDHGADAGFRVAERMRIAVSERRMVFDDIKVSVTVSIGCGLKEACAEISQAIHDADVALYEAKNSGRNRTICYSYQPVAPPMVS